MWECAMETVEVGASRLLLGSVPQAREKPDIKETFDESQ